MMFRGWWIFLIVFGVASTPLFAKKTTIKAKTKHWTYHGQRLFGESWRVQKRSTKALRNYPGLKQQLTNAIESNFKRELAADVIASLKLYPLIDILVKHSKEDQTGHLYLAINALITKKTRNNLIGLYALRIKDPEISPAAKIVMLDTLGRMKHKLDLDLLTNWLENGTYELQVATLNYLRRLKKQFSNKDFRELARLAQNSEWYQLRLQTLFALPYYFIDFDLCIDDDNKKVRANCEILKDKKEINW